MEKPILLPRTRKRYFSRNYAEELIVFRTRFKKVWLFALLFFVVLFPALSDRYSIYIANLVLISIIACLGLNILTGYTGQISLGHGAFVAIGAYAYALLYGKVHLPILLAVLGAGFVSGIMGLVIGMPALRMKGLYLAMATLAFHFIVEQTIMNWDGLTGGYQGITIPKAAFLGFSLKSEARFYYFVLAFCLAMTFAAANICRSKIGRALCAIRDRDLAAEAIGISLTKYKLLSFFISSVYAGVSGALMGGCLGRVAPYDFTLLLSISYISMVIVGGLGSVVGSILGAIAITLLPFILNAMTDALSVYYPLISTRFGDIKTFAYGIIIVVFLIWEPDGLAGRWRRAKIYFTNWPFTY